jgi:hypothetical protein
MARPNQVRRTAHYDVDGIAATQTLLIIDLFGFGFGATGAYFHFEALAAIIAGSTPFGTYLRYRVQGRLDGGSIANLEVNLEYSYADGVNTPRTLTIQEGANGELAFQYSPGSGPNKVVIDVKGVVGE